MCIGAESRESLSREGEGGVVWISNQRRERVKPRERKKTGETDKRETAEKKESETPKRIGTRIKQAERNHKQGNEGGI